MGRPKKLLPDVRAAICKAIAAGQPRHWAAASAGVGASTLRRWLQLARKSDDPELRALRAAVKKAEAAAVAERLAIIRKAARGTTEKVVKITTKPDGSVERVTTSRRVFEWTAAAWWLERMHPTEFSSRRPELDAMMRLANYWNQVLAKAEARTNGGDPKLIDLAARAGLLGPQPGGEHTPGVGGDADPRSI